MIEEKGCFEIHIVVVYNGHNFYHIKKTLNWLNLYADILYLSIDILYYRFYVSQNIFFFIIIMAYPLYGTRKKKIYSIDFTK